MFRGAARILLLSAWSGSAMAVPYGVSIAPDGDAYGITPVPSMKKAKGFRGIVHLDGPGCTLTSADLTRRWDHEMVVAEVAAFDRSFAWSYSPHGEYQTAVECCWREGARLIGWSPIADTDRLESVCAFGMKPIKPVAFEARRSAAVRFNKYQRRCDRGADCIEYHAPVAQQ